MKIDRQTINTIIAAFRRDHRGARPDAITMTAEVCDDIFEELKEIGIAGLPEISPTEFQYLGYHCRVYWTLDGAIFSALMSERFDNQRVLILNKVARK